MKAWTFTLNMTPKPSQACWLLAAHVLILICRLMTCSRVVYCIVSVCGVKVLQLLSLVVLCTAIREDVPKLTKDMEGHVLWLFRFWVEAPRHTTHLDLAMSTP